MSAQIIVSAAIIIAFAYVLGSIPFGLVISAWFYKKDIRNYGSGNIGATNVYRTLGALAGVLVLGFDLLKGLLPVLVAKYAITSSPDMTALVSVLAGLAAIVGHSYSIFLGFSGGKGMSTAAGMVIGLWPLAAPVLFGMWVLIIALTRYVSLASIIIAATLPVLVIAMYPQVEYIGFSLLAAAVLIYRHRSNIGRLLKGTELKFGNKVGAEEK